MKCAVVKGQARLLALSLLAFSSIGVAYSDQLLIEAVKQQDAAAARALIEGDVDVNAPQSDGATALHWAVYRNDLDTAELLLAAGANVNATNDFGVMPLSLACTNGNASMIDALLKAGADSNAALATGETPLMTAARTGELDAVAVLLKHGADVNAKEPSRGQTALMWALSEGHTETARILIEHGATVHAVTEGEFTPLLFAVREGDFEAAEILLDAGADVNATAKDGKSALHVATLRGHADLAIMLLDRGANPNAEDAGFTPLHWAVGTWETELTGRNGIIVPGDHVWSKMRGVQVGKLELVKKLLDDGADPNARLQKNPKRYGFTFASARPKGSTPFMLAALAGDTTIMRMLLNYGADPFLEAENGVTALMMAAGVRRNLSETLTPISDSVEAVKLVVELGADVNAVDHRYGDTALHGAARIKSPEIVQILVDHGAEVNVVNKRGQSPLFMADRYWPPGISMIYQPSAAGDLLRELTPPVVVSKAVEEWATIPPHVREAVESLLQGELEKITAAEQRRSEDPLYPPEGGFPDS